MSRRKKTSGGQALVMVTLALFAMTGIMGLAVDMGWSFFVQRRAQAAADAAALGAVQEAFSRLRAAGNPVSGFTCGSTSAGAGTSKVDCETTVVSCSGVAITSNLNNGCQYAIANGFDWNSGNQRVTMQSNDGQPGDLPVFPNVNGATTNAPVRMSYWVTAGTVQTIPQLFSAILGNNQGVISAVATAAIAASIGPGSFFGMNQAGDCWGFTGLAGSTPTNCGVDILNQSTSAGATCPSGGGTGNICAPSGVVLASTCPNATQTCSWPYAGDGGTQGKGVVTSSVVVNGADASTGGAIINSWTNSTGATVTPVYTSNPATFQDFYVGSPQPPLLATPPLQGPGAIGSCGILNGTINGGTIGPYQYYSYTTSNGGGPIPDGQPIQLGGNVTFSSSAGCPGGSYSISGATQPYAMFPTYIFYGGLSTKNANVTLGPGEYVMAGTNSATQANGSNCPAAGYVLCLNGGTITGDSTTGTMFILTDTNYPGLSTPVVSGLPAQSSTIPNFGISALPGLYQGSVNLKDPTVILTGAVNSTVSGSNLPSNMNVYSGIAIWQDRRNSMIEYNDYPTLAPSCGTNCTTDDGTFVGCANNGSLPGQCVAPQTLAELTENHVTANSPWLNLDPGNGSFTVTGAYYQPRGAWITITHGTGFGGGAFQVITGSFQLTSGNDTLLLQGPTNPILRYKAVLIR